MTSEPAGAFAPHSGETIPQFSPNFTVFQLSPETLCLYSEDRKFLLHGQVFCALAALIAEGGQSFDKLVKALEQTFPREHVQEALQRLIVRRYIVAKPGSLSGLAAAYWASLGLAPDAAEKNLQECRAGIRHSTFKASRSLPMR